MDWEDLLGILGAIGGMMPGDSVVTASDLLCFDRRYPELLPDQAVGDLPQPEYIRYLREHLWDRLAHEKHGRPFEVLLFAEQQDVDLSAMLEIMKAHEQVCQEKETTR